MGQKVDPRRFRVGPTLINNWHSVLYAENNYGDLVVQDIEIRKLINTKHKQAQVSRIVIERLSSQRVIVNIHARRPGVIIGKSGSDIEYLKKAITKITLGTEVFINIHEIKKPDIDAGVIGQNIAQQLEKRVSFRKRRSKIQNPWLYR